MIRLKLEPLAATVRRKQGLYGAGCEAMFVQSSRPCFRPMTWRYLALHGHLGRGICRRVHLSIRVKPDSSLLIQRIVRHNDSMPCILRGYAICMCSAGHRDAPALVFACYGQCADLLSARSPSCQDHDFSIIIFLQHRSVRAVPFLSPSLF